MDAIKLLRKFMLCVEKSPNRRNFSLFAKFESKKKTLARKCYDGRPFFSLSPLQKVKGKLLCRYQKTFLNKKNKQNVIKAFIGDDEHRWNDLGKKGEKNHRKSLQHLLSKKHVTTIFPYIISHNAEKKTFSHSQNVFE